MSSKARGLADLGNAFDDGALSNRNLIINGAMQVAQRGTSVTGVNSTGYRTCDRWRFSPTAGTFTVTQGTSGPSGFANTMRVECTTANSGSSNITLEHRMEGYNLQGIGSGSSDAKPLTLSFWVKSNVVGNYNTELYNNDSTRQISAVFSVDASGVWEKKSISFPADTVGTFGNDNGLSLYLFFWLNASSSFTTGTHNTSSWVNAVNADRVNSDIVNMASAVGNYFEITGVQLEVGDTATPFEHRSYGDELARCQRYYQKMAFSECYMNPPQTAAVMDFVFPTEMRSAPTTTTTNGFGVGTVTAKNAFVFRTLSAGVYDTTVTVEAEL